jgi:hypothetical protein
VVSSALFRLTVVVKGATIDVLPPNPGTDRGGMFTIGGADTYCFKEDPQMVESLAAAQFT